MRRACLLALALLLAGPAAAQTVTVRGGEHEGFTRLVLDLPRATDWALEREGRDVVVALADTDLRFDLSRAFDRIRRVRLRDASAGSAAGRLRLRLGCDCALETFLHTDRMLVVDIADPAEAAEDREVPVTLPLLGRPDALRSEDAPVSGPRLAIATAERRVAQAIGGAASQALLRTTGRARPARASPASTPGPDSAAAPAPGKAPADEPATEDPAAHLATRSALSLPRAIPGSGSSPAPRCMPGQVVDVAAWSDGRPYAVQIGQLRRRLFEDPDHANPERAADLVRLFVHMGFGAEARAVLPLARPVLSSEEAGALTSMAKILDRIGGRPTSGIPAGESGPPPRFTGQRDCRGPAALWAILEPEKPLENGKTIDASAVRRAFQALPVHLRRHVAPDLAARLRAAGRPETAAAVLDAVTRVTPAPLPALDLANAEAALVADRGPEAERRLARVAAEESPEAPRALAALIEARSEAGRPIAQDQAELAASYAREYRDRPLGARLRRARVLALIGAGDLDGALATVEATEAADLAYDRPATLGPLWSAVAEGPDDGAFLRRVFGMADRPGELPAPAAEAVSERLLDLGFAETALDWLGAARSDRVQLLRARAALQLGRPLTAEAELVAVEGAAADRLRARARVAGGDHGAAAQHFSSAGMEDEADRHRLLAGVTVATEAPSALDPVAEGMAVAPPGGGPDGTGARDHDPAKEAWPPDPGAGRTVLERHRALLADSAETRQALDSLLARFAGPDAD